MNIIDVVSNNIEYIVISMAGTIFLLLLLCIIQVIKYNKLSKKYRKFLMGKNGESLEEIITGKIEDVEKLKKNTEHITQEIIELKEVVSATYQKMSIVKYDAFKEMGGKLSFALALLDDQNNGFVINAMHSSREGCYTYVKEIIHGESFIVLSNEEKEALEAAINKKNYME